MNIRKVGLLFMLMVFIIIPTIAQTTEISPELQEQLTNIENFVSEYRGLPILETVPKQFITREEALTMVAENTQANFSESAMERELFYRALGFVSDDFRFVDTYSEFIGNEVYGFYSSSLGVITVVLPEDESLGDELPLAQQFIYAHEFVHVLQEQHFGFPLGDTPNPDRYMALYALIEGDPSLVMRGYLTYAVQNNLGDINSLTQQLSDDNTIASPQIMDDELNFAYGDGVAFITFLQTRGGWDAVNDAYNNIPQSTEQILQPSKNIAGEAPIPVELTDVSAILGEDWQLISTGTIGLFYLREYLSQYLSDGVVYLAVNGWGGDTMTIYYQPDTDELAWVMGITWDDPLDKELREFGDAYTQFLENQFDEFTDTPFCGVSDAQTICFATTDTTSFIASAPTTDLAQALLTELTGE